VKVRIEGEGLKRHLAFEYFPTDPANRPKSKEEDEGEETVEGDDVPALVDGTPAKKALPSPKGRGKNGANGTGSVPGVPRKRDD
jgi:hypothetical protein